MCSIIGSYYYYYYCANNYNTYSHRSYIITPRSQRKCRHRTPCLDIKHMAKPPAFQRFTLWDAKPSHPQVSWAVIKHPGPLPGYTLPGLGPRRCCSSFTGMPVWATVAKVFQKHSLHLFCLILTFCFSLLLNAFVCKKSHKRKFSPQIRI